jgi:hypothetical protein
MTSAFDPSAFLDATTTEAATARPPLPVGDYVATISDIEFKNGISAKTGNPWNKAEMILSLEIPGEVRDLIGISTANLTLRDGVMLDVTPQGGLDWSPGKNRGLRNYRVATDNNEPGKAFSLSMLKGQIVRVKVGHEAYEDRLLERINGVTKF